MSVGTGKIQMRHVKLSVGDYWDLFELVERYQLSYNFRSLLGTLIESTIPFHPYGDLQHWTRRLGDMTPEKVEIALFKLRIVAQELQLSRLWTSLLGTTAVVPRWVTENLMPRYLDAMAAIVAVMETAARLQHRHPWPIIVGYTESKQMYLRSSLEDEKILHYF